MKNSTNDFNTLARTKVEKHHTQFSLRLSFDERGLLEHDAAGQALGAYIRERLFGEDVTPRTIRGKFPVKDQAVHQAFQASPAPETTWKGQEENGKGGSHEHDHHNERAERAHKSRTR